MTAMTQARAAALLAVAGILISAMAAYAQAKKPNILVIWGGNDIGWYNISAYNLGVMGYKTPNIDRIAREGALFTDWYGQQSCTAGRAAFLTGQSPIRTGLTKVGLPGAPEGLTAADPTIADLLKAQGYTTGQFGKNHLGDRNEHIPTVHGFDEFYGNFYHLNAEEEPENPRLPEGPGVQGEVRSTRRDEVQGNRCREHHRCGSAPRRPGASRAARIPALSRRSGWRRSTTT
jgi:arylsulfatase A-like enzyme